MTPGYNISISVNGNTILGRTQDDLTIAAQVKESITKDDQGVKQYAVTGHDITLKCSGLIGVTASGQTTQLSCADVMALALKKSSDTGGCDVTIAYSGGGSVSGTGIITGYNESSSADPDSDSTYSVDLKIITITA